MRKDIEDKARPWRLKIQKMKSLVSYLTSIGLALILHVPTSQRRLFLLHLNVLKEEEIRSIRSNHLTTDH